MWTMTADPCSVSYQQDLPKFPFSIHYGCLSKQPWWITVCLLKPSRPLLKDVNPSVSSNFTQTVTMPVLMLSTMTSTPGTSEFGMRRNLLYFVSFSSTYKGPPCVCLEPGEGHTGKVGNRQALAAVSSIFLWLWAFFAERDNARCGILVSIFLHTAEKGYLNLWFYTKKWLIKGKSTLCLLLASSFMCN